VEAFLRKFEVNGQKINIKNNKCPLINDVILKKDIEMYGSNVYNKNIIKSWLIQAFRKKWTAECTKCTEGKGPYHECIALEGLLNKTCDNCRRLGKAAQCTFHEKNMAEQERRIGEAEDAGRMKRMGRRQIPGREELSVERSPESG
jgi:hypothetical protein